MGGDACCCFARWDDTGALCRADGPSSSRCILLLVRNDSHGNAHCAFQFVGFIFVYLLLPPPCSWLVAWVTPAHDISGDDDADWHARLHGRRRWRLWGHARGHAPAFNARRATSGVAASIGGSSGERAGNASRHDGDGAWRCAACGSYGGLAQQPVRFGLDGGTILVLQAGGIRQ